MLAINWKSNFPHFTPEEYFSPDGLQLFYADGIVPADLQILHEVERLRGFLNGQREKGLLHFDREITLRINDERGRLRGWVSPREFIEDRIKRPGQFFTFHLWCAADVSSNLDVDRLFSAAKKLNFSGIIKYNWGLHLDLRQGAKYVSER